MRVVAIEEHVGSPELMSRIPSGRIESRGWGSLDALPPIYREFARRLAEGGDARIAEMDRDGVDMQVLSVTGPGADLLDPDEAPSFARDYNNFVAETVKRHPARFAAFAHLPMSAPEAAADEFERTVVEHGFCGAMVNGTTAGAFLDDRRFDPILSRAVKLDLPIYLHPAPPEEPVRQAYYGRLPGPAGPLLATAGWGWHAETALHVLRLALSGTFDRHAGLKIVIGHMGEGLPAMLERADGVMSKAMRGAMDRSVSETILDHVMVTTSGFVAGAAFDALLATFGPRRIMFGIDYPYSPGGPQVEFLKAMPLPEDAVCGIAHANAEALLKLSG